MNENEDAEYYEMREQVERDWMAAVDAAADRARVDALRAALDAVPEPGDWCGECQIAQGWVSAVVEAAELVVRPPA